MRACKDGLWRRALTSIQSAEKWLLMTFGATVTSLGSSVRESESSSAETTGGATSETGRYLNGSFWVKNRRNRPTDPGPDWVAFLAPTKAEALWRWHERNTSASGFGLFVGRTSRTANWAR